MNPDINTASATSAPHRRRPRYHGANPRRFEEKYKELEPERYPEDVEKILASGKTPAGTHRPICVNEILELLAPRPGDVGVDCTLGYGGHARELISRILPGGRLFTLDVDPIESSKTEARFRAEGIGPETLTVHHTNFAGLPRLLGAEGVAGVDFILADLGISSMQLDNPARGFSCKYDGPLDLRLNPERGRAASAWLESLTEAELQRALTTNADEPHAQIIARVIHEAQVRQPIRTTTELARLLRGALGSSTHARQREEVETSVRRTFQALRILVNDEFSALETFLRFLPDCLKPGGRVAILTFHSGEDRRVKKAFQAGEREGVYRSLASEIIRPTADEQRANPRCTSAKLRWAIRS